MRLIVLAVLVCLVKQLCSAEKVSYRGYKVLQTTPRTEQQLAFLAELLDVVDVDVWKPVSTVKRSVIVNVAPKISDDFQDKLTSKGLDVKTNIEDLQLALEQQLQGRWQGPTNVNLDHGFYRDYDQILELLDVLADVHPSMANRFDVGTQSYEDRDMLGVRINSNASAERPAFWIQGGIHGREWISPATVLYIVAKFLEQYDSDPAIREVVDMFDWYFLPVTNPDGYVYTWDTDRVWKKNRYYSADDGPCIGTDLSRNWDMHWCEEGASKNPCAPTYCGPSAFSEAEVKGVADFIISNGNFKAFIDLHSYSQLWTSPWSYTNTQPVDFNIQDNGSQLAVAALEAVHGTVYEHGSYAQNLHESSGSSIDWAYGKAGVKFSYHVELRDTGTDGFLLPEELIEPTGQETMKALMALATYVHDN